MNDIWTWVWRSIYQEEGRREWFVEWRRALDLDETNPQAAIAIIEATAARAANARDLWWKLFLEHWKLQILLNKTRDFSAALDCAAKATVEVRQSQFDAFPQRVCLHEDLITAYQGLDPVGYAPMIQKALDYMQGEIAPGVECEMCHLGLRCEFYLSIRHPETTEAGLAYLERTQSLGHEFHGAQAYLQLCHIEAELHGTKAKERLDEYSQLGLELANRAGYSEGLHEVLMWRALAARWNHDAEAGRAFHRAVQARERYGAAARPGYYIAGVLYHEAGENAENALKLLDVELEEIKGRGEFWREATRRLKKCELLREMGLPWAGEAEKVRALAPKLKEPTLIEERLKTLDASG